VVACETRPNPTGDELLSKRKGNERALSMSASSASSSARRSATRQSYQGIRHPARQSPRLPCHGPVDYSPPAELLDFGILDRIRSA
jgi:hypothetical protein